MIRLDSYYTTKRTPEIEMPDMLELINCPFYHLASLDDVYKYSNDTLRYLIDKLNLNNNAQYVSAQINVQYLNQKVVTVPRATWHHDVADEKFTTHLLITGCSAMTEFLAEDLVLENMNLEDCDNYNIEMYLSSNKQSFKRIDCEPNKFISFTDQYHSAKHATKPEFRFTMRVIESDNFQPKTYHEALLTNSVVFPDDLDYSNLTKESIEKLTRQQIKLPSIVKDGKKIIINTYDK